MGSSVRLHTIWNHLYLASENHLCIYKPSVSFLIKVFPGPAWKVDYSLRAFPSQVQDGALRALETTNLPSNKPRNLRTETGLREHLAQLPHSTMSSPKYLIPFTHRFLGTSYIRVTKQQKVQKEERTFLPSRRWASGRKDGAVTLNEVRSKPWKRLERQPPWSQREERPLPWWRQRRGDTGDGLGRADMNRALDSRVDRGSPRRKISAWAERQEITMGQCVGSSRYSNDP